MGRPKGDKLSIQSLRRQTYLGEGDIHDIRLLGCDRKISWTRDRQGLHIDLPPERPYDYAYAFEVEINGAVNRD